MFNKVILQGRLVRDPEQTATASGIVICKFTIANNRKIKDRDETLFIDCTAFNKIAEICCRCLVKGSLCIIAGKLTCEKWTGNDGQEKQKNAIIIEEVEFISTPGHQPQYQQPPSYQARQPITQPVQAAITQAIKDHKAQSEQDALGDDIPF